MTTSFFDNRVTTTKEKSFSISIGGYEKEFFTSAQDATNWIISFYGKSQDKFLEIFNFLNSIVSRYENTDLGLSIEKF